MFKTYKRTKKAKKTNGKLTYAQTKEVRAMVKYQINKQLAPEEKYHSSEILTASNSLANSGTGSVSNDLTAVPQGITDSSRIGDDCKIKRLNIRLSLEALSTYIQGTIRILIFQWHMDTTIQVPTPPLIYMNSISGGIDALSNFNEDSKTSRMFTVLYDRTMPVMLNTVGRPFGGDQSSANIKVPLKWAKKNIHFTSADSKGKDHIFLLINADKPSAGTDAVKYAYSARMHFIDV